MHFSDKGALGSPGIQVKLATAKVLLLHQPRLNSHPKPAVVPDVQYISYEYNSASQYTSTIRYCFRCNTTKFIPLAISTMHSNSSLDSMLSNFIPYLQQVEYASVKLEGALLIKY